MAQIKIFGLREQLYPIRKELSDAIHACVVMALGLPEGKRAHRFMPLEREDFYFPAGRSQRYTIIEISMFEGRTVETKKHLIRLLYKELWRRCQLEANDVEITISETPRANWGIRGLPGDELTLNYEVNV